MNKFHDENEAVPVSRRNFLKVAAAGMSVTFLRGEYALAKAKAGYNEITNLNALDLSAAIKAKRYSCVEVMEAYLANISRLNETFNAIVSMESADRLIEQARRADLDLSKGSYHGWMHGFPLAVKDLANAKGFINSMGSPLYDKNISRIDDIFVERMKGQGAIVIGKTNVPEFGLGSQTYNPVFGSTKNAWDASSTAGGSSGGAAVSLALHMLPVADGSDMMGSLRNPAGYNNVVAFRPSPGRVPLSQLFMEELPCNGPMGRNVSDTAKLLSTMAGYDQRAPTTFPQDPAHFSQSLARDWKSTSIGWLGDLGGYLPMEQGVLALCEKAINTFETIGCNVEYASIDFSMEHLWQTWLTYRHWNIRGLLADDYADPKRRELLKPECIWEIEGGLHLSAQEVYEASVARSHFYSAILKAFQKYDFLVIPTAQVFPFDAQIHWPTEIAGKRMDSYHRWMEVTVPGTLSGCPVAAVPAGFGKNNLPMGLQIIGPRYEDLSTLQIAYAYEQAARWNIDKVPTSV